LRSCPRWLALVGTVGGPSPVLTGLLVAGLLVFGGLFAVNSSLHSYLILAFTRAERVTMDVGFYYMANAAGRLIGTVLSGLTYQLGGLPLTLGTAASCSCVRPGRRGTCAGTPGACGGIGRDPRFPL
jgi:hypothetical protein